MSGILKSLQYALGVLLILVGIAGLFLPILQGILLIALGVVVLKADKISTVWPDVKSKTKRLFNK